jgi:formaldehyde-activating enzyme involved in methanogenesis
VNPLAFITGNWQRLLAYGIAIVAVVGAVWSHGYMHGKQKLFEYQAEQAKAAVAVARAGAPSPRRWSRDTSRSPARRRR